MTDTEQAARREARIRKQAVGACTVCTRPALVQFVGIGRLCVLCIFYASEVSQ